MIYLKCQKTGRSYVEALLFHRKVSVHDLDLPRLLVTLTSLGARGGVLFWFWRV